MSTVSREDVDYTRPFPFSNGVQGVIARHGYRGVDHYGYKVDQCDQVALVEIVSHNYQVDDHAGDVDRYHQPHESQVFGHE